MKLYEGFHAFGYEVRWQEPSEARDRPEGFWQETGHSVEFFYQQTMLWFGGPDGLSRVAIEKKDDAGTPIYKPCWGPTWEGRQGMQKDQGDLWWEDYWYMDMDWPEQIKVAHGWIQVLWQTFDSTWTGYMSSVHDGLYAERYKVKGGLVPPYTEDLGCYDVDYDAIWS